MQDGLDPTPGINNQFATIPDVSVDAVANRVAPRQVATGVTRGIQQLGSDKVYSDGGNNQIIVEDTSTPRVLVGDQATFGKGLYVSKAGINAKTNTDPAQWIFNSNQNVFKIASSNVSTLVLPATLTSGTTNTVTIAHGQTGIPAIIAYLSGTGSGYLTANTYYQMPYTLPALIGATYQPGIQFSYRIDVLNVYFDVSNYTSVGISGIGTATFKYYILQETAS